MSDLHHFEKKEKRKRQFDPIVPKVWSGGSDPSKLHQERADALMALLEAKRALVASGPHRRDFLSESSHGGCAGFKQACDEHVTRLATLENLICAIEDECVAIDLQAMKIAARRRMEER